MRVGVIQSSYIPWRGYFDFIASVDIFVFYDDVQYSSGSWRNRNQLKTQNGLQWLSVPVKYSFKDPIDTVAISQTTGAPWQERHRQMLTEALRSAPYFSDAMDIWEKVISREDSMLSLLNQHLIEEICTSLGICTRIVLSRDYSLSGTKTTRLLDLLNKLGATTYLSGPAAKSYLDECLFAESDIALEYKTYDYEPYPQLWGPFEGAVSILDLIANTGPSAREHLPSRTPNVVAVPSTRSSLQIR